jgi:hypothetical protein
MRGLTDRVIRVSAPNQGTWAAAQKDDLTIQNREAQDSSIMWNAARQREYDSLTRALI